MRKSRAIIFIEITYHLLFIFKFPPLCIMLNLLHREFKTFSLILPYFYTLLKLLLHYFLIFKKPLCDHVRTTECAVAKKAENGRGVECRVGGSKKNYSLKSSVVQYSSTYSIIYCSKRKFGPWLLYTLVQYYVRSFLFLLLKNYSREHWRFCLLYQQSPNKLL